MLNKLSLIKFCPPKKCSGTSQKLNILSNFPWMEEIILLYYQVEFRNQTITVGHGFKTDLF